MGRSSGAIAALALLTIGVALGSASRASYHEAIWAQAAREVLAGGDPIVPTIDGRPWLEKPPLGIWLIAAVGGLAGGIDAWVARLPSLIGAIGVALAVASFAGRRYGPGVGLVAGLVQVTTAWTVARGRLAEADILLAALVAGAFAAFDRVRLGDRGLARWAFFGLLGAAGLAKGIGFGAALIGATAVVVLLWDRDRATAGALLRAPGGWLLATLLTMAWPLAVLVKHPGAFGLWFHHLADRFDPPRGSFAGEPWGEYAASPLLMLLPWTPLAMAGAWRSWRTARDIPGGAERLLWAWAIVPALLVSTARARNAHYLLPSLAPWSAWTALALARTGERLAARGWGVAGRRKLAALAFLAIGLIWGIGYATLGPRLDHRGPEWAFYEEVGRLVPAAEPVVFLYDDWDRRPYETPFGPLPHDLAARFFHLGRSALWRDSPSSLADDPPPGASFAVVGRSRDLADLEKLGTLAILARGPTLREPASRVDDREFLLIRVDREGSGPNLWSDCARFADSRGTAAPLSSSSGLAKESR